MRPEAQEPEGPGLGLPRAPDGSEGPESPCTSNPEEEVRTGTREEERGTLQGKVRAGGFPSMFAMTGQPLGWSLRS